jgi:hypothetical protein
VLAYLSIVNLRQKQKATGWFNCPADGLFRKKCASKRVSGGARNARADNNADVEEGQH